MVVAPRILFVASEAVPLAKTGGLADVAGALPEALARLGADVRLVMPFYRSVREQELDLARHEVSVDAWLGDSWAPFGILEGRTPGGVPVYLVERHDLYDRPELYGGGSWEYPDNLERFAFFSHAALRIAEVLGFPPHVVHAHDWQAGLTLALMEGPYRHTPALGEARRVLTVHNLGYQGLFPKELLGHTGLGPEFLQVGGLEHHGSISLLMAGVAYADAITTVSPTYAKEITGKEHGMGMEGVLAYRRDRLHGILNGIDTARWDPAHDPHLHARYRLGNMEGKRTCKLGLLRELGMDHDGPRQMPLVGMTTRLAAQKGLDILAPVLDDIVEAGLSLAVLGEGDDRYKAALQEAARRHPGRIGLRFGFDEGLAHRVVAGSDIFLVPSRYEPCGLTQMYALRYGTIPVVRATGGLEDTVEEYDPRSMRGTGFKFRGYDPEALLRALREARLLYWNAPRWQSLQERGMSLDWSWDRSARAYLELFASL